MVVKMQYEDVNKSILIKQYAPIKKIHNKRFFPTTTPIEMSMYYYKRWITKAKQSFSVLSFLEQIEIIYPTEYAKRINKCHITAKKYLLKLCKQGLALKLNRQFILNLPVSNPEYIYLQNLYSDVEELFPFILKVLYRIYIDFYKKNKKIRKSTLTKIVNSWSSNNGKYGIDKQTRKQVLWLLQRVLFIVSFPYFHNKINIVFYMPYFRK